MASAEDVYRESQARLHKILGSYLALRAWKEGADCVVIQRESFLKFLQLQRMRDARIDWVKDDLAHLFKYANTTVNSKSGNYASLYLSRVKFPKQVFSGSLNVKGRIARFKENGLKLIEVELTTEKELLTTMSLVFSGIEEI